MHRVAPDRAAPPSPRRRVVAIGLMALALAGCASAPQQVADPPTIDKLRVRITKTRHAIRETREAIARSQGSPALPELHVRLAELLSEEARYHNQVAYEREDRKSRVIHAPQVRLLKLQAIDIYKQVLTRFPDTPLAPRVRFNIGHELRELGDFPQMVATLEGLVSAHPDSPLADEALLVLGDYHFDKAELDPAARFYAQITRRPLTRVTGLAHYKLAWVQVNKGSCRRALSGFEEAMKSAAAWDAHKAEVAAAGGGDPRASATFGSGAGGGADAPSAGQAIDVRREALVDLVYCYTQERDPAKAVSWLRERSVDRYAYVHALRRMADRLAFMGQREAGLAVSRALLGLAPANPDRLDDARVLYAFLAGAEDDELALLVEARDIAMLTETVAHHVQRPGLTDELRAKILEEFERYARDLLTRGQERAQRLKQGPAKGAALAQIAAGYVIYLDAFRDAPEQLAILKNLAEVLGATGRDVEAGLRWFEIADLAVEPEPRKAALLEAVGHLQRALQREGAREQVGRVVARASLRRSGEALLAGPLTPEEARAVEFAVALTYADEGRYREAIDRFTALAYQFPGTDEADAAALSALDAYESNSDYDGLIVAGRRFVAEGSPLSPATIERIRPAIARAETRKLDELALTASGSEGGDLAALERFAERYQGTSLGERALINAFVAARAVGDSGSLQRLGARLVAEYPASEQASGVITSLARNAVASLDYDRAIEAFEQAAKTQAADSSALLTTAAALMAQLGDDAGAIRVLKQAQGLAKTPAARAAVGARLAARLEQSGASPAATAAALAPLGREGGPEVLATLGLAQVALGRVEDAEVSFDGVLGGSAESSPEAKARAHYGNAEAMAAVLRGFDPGGSVEGIEEFATLAEVAEQSFMNAARQGSPLVTAASLSRLAVMARETAARLEGVRLPASLSEADAGAVRAALGERATALRTLADSALATCAEQAWSNKLFNPVVRRCLAGESLKSPALPHDVVKRRVRRARSEDLTTVQERIAANPDDAKTLASAGEALLDAGDAHTARLILARALAAGGGPDVANLLGNAHFEVGDYTGALESFARAADGGREAGRANLKTALTRLGLGAQAAKVDEVWPNAGEPGGRPLDGGGR